jgi:hypothetical protein
VGGGIKKGNFGGEGVVDLCGGGLGKIEDGEIDGMGGGRNGWSWMINGKVVDRGRDNIWEGGEGEDDLF